MVVSISCCHPGYTFNNKTSLCEISDTSDIIVRAHPRGRYFYAQVDLLIKVAMVINFMLFFSSEWTLCRELEWNSGVGCDSTHIPGLLQRRISAWLSGQVWLSQRTMCKWKKRFALKFCAMFSDELPHFCLIGFLCGQCPDGEGVDFTLRQCKKCTIQDAVFVTAFCKILLNKSMLLLYLSLQQLWCSLLYLY